MPHSCKCTKPHCSVQSNAYPTAHHHCGQLNTISSTHNSASAHKEQWQIQVTVSNAPPEVAQCWLPLRLSSVAVVILSSNNMPISPQNGLNFGSLRPAGAGDLFFFLCNLFLGQVNKKIECTWRRQYYFFFGFAPCLDFGNLVFLAKVQQCPINHWACQVGQSVHEAPLDQMCNASPVTPTPYGIRLTMQGAVLLPHGAR